MFVQSRNVSIIPKFTTRALSLSSSLSNEQFSKAQMVEEFEAEIKQRQETKNTLSSLFKNVTNFKSKEKLTNYLFKSIVYNNPDDKTGLIGINKPYGLAKYKAEDSEFCLEDCLPGLAERLEIEKLEIIKTPERFTSGVTLLAPPNKGAREKLDKINKRKKSARWLPDSYLTIVNGHANINLVEDFAVELKEMKTGDKPLFSATLKEPVIVKTSDNRWQRIKTQQRLRHIQISTINKSNKIPLTLLNVSPSKTNNHLIRFYLAHKGYHVLGDNLYSYRAKEVMGTKVAWNQVATPVANRNQILPKSTLELFGLLKSEVYRIPACIHLWRCLLPGWLGKDNDLTLFAPPPKYFEQTLITAGIKLDMDSLMKNDKPAQFQAKIKPKKKAKRDEILDEDVIKVM